MSHFTSVDSVAKKSKATTPRPNRLNHRRVICFVCGISSGLKEGTEDSKPDTAWLVN